MRERKKKKREKVKDIFFVRRHVSRAFTLIEMLISVALFSIVVLVAVGALLSLVGANRKAQALQSVMNNLNITIDSMVRNARQGTNYDGSAACTSNSGGGPKDCTGGSTAFTFTTYDNHIWTYTFVAPSVNGASGACGNVNGCITKSVDGAATVPVTALEVSITNMKFYVVGTTRGDTTQPKVVIVIAGTAGGTTDVKVATSFHIQATAVQRVLDL